MEQLPTDGIETTAGPGASGTELPADTRFDLVLLDPSRVVFFRTSEARTRVTITDPVLGGDRSYVTVAVARAFPLSHPDRYIGLRDGEDRDIGMLETLDQLDRQSQAIVREELERRYFLPRVMKVIKVKEEFGLTTWQVETDRGPQTFMVRHLREAIQNLSSTRILMTDVDGNRWDFADLGQLTGEAYAIIERAR